MSLHIKNPHSILAAIEARPQDVLQVILPPNPRDDWEKIGGLALKKGIKVLTGQSAPRESRDRDRGAGKGRDREVPGLRADAGRTSVAEAVIKEKAPIAVETLFEGAAERAGGRGLWIALDSLQDPHNVGAIFRTASFFGVQGILLTQERSAPMSAAVYDVASGGVEDVPFAIQINLQRALEIAKKQGLWILGTSEHARQDFSAIERDRPWLLVLGNEEKGMRRLTQENCDMLCRIAPRGKVTSLNVSVAAGIFISKLA